MTMSIFHADYPNPDSSPILDGNSFITEDRSKTGRRPSLPEKELSLGLPFIPEKQWFFQ
jgi:hypothetical protein